LKALLKTILNPLIIFLKNFFEKDQVAKYYFPSFIQTYASTFAKELSYKMIYKVFYAKGMFEKYISKLFL
jgi:hypothetical protein